MFFDDDDLEDEWPLDDDNQIPMDKYELWELIKELDKVDFNWIKKKINSK